MTKAQPVAPDWHLKLLARRRSASAEASFQAELERVRGMSIEQRVLEALTMSERFAWLVPTPLQDEP